MADIKSKYPSPSSIALSITLAGLASDTALLAGRASAAVDNTTNLDLDHAVSGVITTGSSVTAASSIEVWAWASYKTANGTPTYPDSITGTDAAKTMTSNGVKSGALRQVATLTLDATANRAYPFAPVSIAGLFNGAMPKFWGIFVTQSSGAALNATAASHDIQYERSQTQAV